MLYAGADVNAQDSYGESALHAAASAGHLDIVRILAVEHEAALDVQNWEGWTPLICAVVRGHTAVAKFLAERVRCLLHPWLQRRFVTWFLIANQCCCVKGWPANGSMLGTARGA
jgi:ankyrin repeat protein